jgi:hypothetical protein
MCATSDKINEVNVTNCYSKDQKTCFKDKG